RAASMWASVASFRSRWWPARPVGAGSGSTTYRNGLPHGPVARRTAMEDEDLLERINRLAAEEHRLHEAHVGGGLSDEERARLREVEVGLDLCWDLLRQRRALRNAGLDPSDAATRSEGTVEGYQQ